VVTQTRIAIIGAGMAGLACARVLADAGHDVRVFDKGRGPGGRMSTRRVQTAMSEVQFDHGAQYFTARDPAFVGLIAEFVATNAVAPWHGNLVRLAKDGTNSPLANETLYVGVPGMNGIVRAMSIGLNVAWGVRVETLQRHKGAWMLLSDQGEGLGEFDQLVCAVPAEQVAPLIQSHAPDLAARAKDVTSLPCWTGMFAFEAPLSSPFDAIRLDDHPMIDFIAANHSKPGREASGTAGPSTYVVQARADWSRLHLEDEADSVTADLLAGLHSFSDNQPSLVSSTAHRWRFAKVEVQHGIGCAFDEVSCIGVCGDWLSGPRVESAWVSGHTLGSQMAQRLMSV
jgi:renalase